jgi:hypothetical protein
MSQIHAKVFLPDECRRHREPQDRIRREGRGESKSSLSGPVSLTHTRPQASLLFHWQGWLSEIFLPFPFMPLVSLSLPPCICVSPPIPPSSMDHHGPTALGISRDPKPKIQDRILLLIREPGISGISAFVLCACACTCCAPYSRRTA